MHDVTALLIGSGGREHAIARAVAASPRLKKLLAAPGNPGIAAVADNVDVAAADHAAVIRFVEENRVDLVIIGPEAPLVAGLADDLRAKGIRVVGAGKEAARLEGSKIFAKQFMARHGIPTAAFREFNDAKQAKAFALSSEGRTYRVLKADGLAAGKGVFVARSADEILEAIRTVMEEKKFGEAGARILLEEKLEGPEVSLMALTDGKTLLPFPASQDHKRVFDNDQGPNTGGMGAYAPTPFYDSQIRPKVNQHILENFLGGLKAEKLDFRGIIYFGLMLTPKGPHVLEFNVRFGDPETQVVLPLIESDMLEAFLAVAEGRLSDVRLQIRPRSACTVVLCSGGYPGNFSTGYPISGLDGLDADENIHVYHAGTKRIDGKVATAGGRVLNITGFGRTLDAAVVRAYQGVKRVGFQNSHFRNDIAARALTNRSIAQKIKKMRIRYAKETTLAS